MKKVILFIAMMVLVFSIFSISVCAYYDFLSPESNINIEKLKHKYEYTPIINIDITTATLINEQDLSDYNQAGEPVFIPPLPEVLEKIENEGYQYNPSIVNYYEKKGYEERVTEFNFTYTDITEVKNEDTNDIPDNPTIGTTFTGSSGQSYKFTEDDTVDIQGNVTFISDGKWDVVEI